MSIYVFCSGPGVDTSHFFCFQCHVTIAIYSGFCFNPSNILNDEILGRMSGDIYRKIEVTICLASGGSFFSPTLSVKKRRNFIIRLQFLRCSREHMLSISTYINFLRVYLLYVNFLIYIWWCDSWEYMLPWVWYTYCFFQQKNKLVLSSKFHPKQFASWNSSSALQSFLHLWASQGEFPNVSIFL